MRLDRYDAMATAATALTGLVYWAHASDVVPLRSARVTALAMLVTGLTACATNGRRPDATVSGTTYTNVMAFLGLVAMALVLAAVVSGYESLLTGLAVLVGALWAVTTVKHLVVGPTAPVAPAVTRERELVRR